MKKKIAEYQEKYGYIPNDFYDRFIFMIKELKLSVKQVNELKDHIQAFLTGIEWRSVEFLFYLIPESSPRPRYSRFTKSFYVKNAKEDREYFKEYIDKNTDGVSVITTPCKFLADVYLPIPSGMNKFEKIFSELKLMRPVSTPDWDNMGKKYSDMVQTELILNDSLIIDGHVRKYYSCKPRIEIHVDYMTKYDSKFNKSKVEHWTSYQSNINIDKKPHILE